jgi:hypothetical protein
MSHCIRKEGGSEWETLLALESLSNISEVIPFFGEAIACVSFLSFNSQVFCIFLALMSNIKICFWLEEWLKW